MNEGVLFEGRFRWEIWSAPEYSLGPLGVLDRPISNRRRIDSGSFSNGIITLSINDLLDVYFANGTPNAAWYIGVIDSTSFSTLSASDTMSSHAGWIESTAYSQGTRPAWSPGVSAGGIKTNPSAAVATASSDITLQGLFVTSNSTKGGTTGTLWSTGTFGTERHLSTGQQLKMFYEIRGRAG